MDGKGRALDNVMIERLWRTVKYDDIYIRGYETMAELYQGLKRVLPQIQRSQAPDTGHEPRRKVSQRI